MTSKRTVASKRASLKRASLPRATDYAKSFLKDWERLSRAGRYDMNRLKEAMLLLIANDAPLGQEWLNHRSVILTQTCSLGERAWDRLSLFAVQYVRSVGHD